jgi:hypothetical protein
VFTVLTPIHINNVGVEENMKSIKISICLILLLAVMGSQNIAYGTEQLEKSTSDNLINTFSYSNTPDEYQGCTCSFHPDTSSRALVFISKISEREKTLMKIDGIFVYLKSKEPLNDAMDIMGRVMTKKIGAKLNYEYIAAEINVNIELISTSACAPEDEKCESQKYSAIITAIKGNKKQTIRANGSCGC